MKKNIIEPLLFVSACVTLLCSLIVLVSTRVAADQCLDFWWIWLSAKFAVAGQLASAYDYPTLAAAAQAANHCIIQHLDYPPILFLFTFPIGWLTHHDVAYLAWVSVTGCLFLCAVYRIVPQKAAIFATMSLACVFWNIVLGHDGFLTGALFGFALPNMERKAWLSGFLIGCIAYKPQFGMLFPLAFFATRDWRMMLASAMGVITVVVLAGLCFGFDAWSAWIPALHDRASAITQMRGNADYIASLFGYLRRYWVSSETAWTIQVSVSMVVAAAVYLIWCSKTSHDLKAAALALGAFAASPHTFPYDATIIAIGGAFLIRDYLARGYERAEAWGSGACCVLGSFPALLPFVSHIACVSLYSIACAAGLLTLVARRVVRENANRRYRILSARGIA
jgi:hypothetical protein